MSQQTVFDIIEPTTGEVLTTVVVEPEDLYGEEPVTVFEMRYESALARVGLTYDDAVQRAVYVRTFTQEAR